MGPVISPAAKNKILDLIQSGVDEGAKILLDGRNVSVPGYEKGNFIGPTILTDVKVIFCNMFRRFIRLFDSFILLYTASYEMLY